MSPKRRAHRSYLYVAGSDPHRFEKARLSGADAIILDLEDAVAAQAKDEARAHVAHYLQAVASSDVGIHARINALEQGQQDADLDATVWPAVETLRVAKAERPAELRELDLALTRREVQRGIEPGTIGLTLLVESARGAFALAELIDSSPRVTTVALGSTDFLADIDARGADETATLYVRSQLVLTARALGLLAPIDSVTTALDDPDAAPQAARFARGLGFFGKSLIHPRQIDGVHAVFSPTEAELARARAVVAVADAAATSGRGAATYQGEFVDPAIVARYRALLSRERTLR